VIELHRWRLRGRACRITIRRSSSSWAPWSSVRLIAGAGTRSASSSNGSCARSVTLNRAHTAGLAPVIPPPTVVRKLRK
jgi:hypothetical protein